MALSKPYSCRICGLDFEEHEGRLHGPTFRCKTCESCLKQIRRNVDKPDLEIFSDQEQKDFFRKLQAEKAKADGRLPWTVIRASLVTAMTTRSVLAYKAEVHGKKLPLEVWTKKGWSKETIERMPSEYSEEYGCTVYQVKVKAETWSDTFERMDSRVLEQEQRATKKKGKKTDEDLALPDQLEPGVSKSDPKKEEKSKAATQKKIRATNLTQSNRAAKAMGPLQSSATSLGRVWQRAQKHLDLVPEGVQESCKRIVNNLESWAASARACVNQQEANKSVPADAEVAALPPLAFTAEDLKAIVKQSTEVSKVIRDSMPRKEVAAVGKTPAENTQQDAPPAKRRRGKGNP